MTDSQEKPIEDFMYVLSEYIDARIAAALLNKEEGSTSYRSYGNRIDYKEKELKKILKQLVD